MIRNLRLSLSADDTKKTLNKLNEQIRLMKKTQKVTKLRHRRALAAQKKSFAADLKTKLAEKDEVITEVQNSNLLLEEKVLELSTPEKMASKRDKKTYSTNVRMMVYSYIVNQVPMKSIPILLQQNGQFFGVDITDIPHRNTVEEMARELGIVCELQAAEIASSTPNLTLGFDATTQEDVHVNAIHLTTKEQCIVVAVDELPGGTADDYARHITESVDHLAFLHSDLHKQDFADCRTTIIGNITNTMTDRAAVNHATVQKVNQEWGKELNELNCHLHPLDSIATACKKALKSFELKKLEKELYGNDCIAGNIVLQMNKLRYKNGKGDPSGFVTFLRKAQLKRGLLPRYRGNRLHVLFKTCAIFVEHYPAFLEFLSTTAVSCGTLAERLKAAFENPIATRQMCILALLSKLLTGPWMTKFYTTAETPTSHLEGIIVVKSVIENIADTCKAPMEILDTDTDFFGNQIGGPTLQTILHSCPHEKDDMFREMVVCCLDGVLNVLNRQYERYFQMEITEVLRQETETARLHNIDSEELMGMFSAEKKHSPNATLCFLSSKLRSIKNKAFEYLQSMDPQQREKTVRWCVSKAKQKRRANRLRHEQLLQELTRRTELKRQKKEDKERKQLEKMLASLQVKDIPTKFPDLEEKALADLIDILSDQIVSRNVCHLWMDNETQNHVLYYGKIEKKKKKKESTYVVAYWIAKEEEYDDAVEYDMTKFALAADVVNGELILS